MNKSVLIATLLLGANLLTAAQPAAAFGDMNMSPFGSGGSPWSGGGMPWGGGGSPWSGGGMPWGGNQGNGGGMPWGGNGFGPW